MEIAGRFSMSSAGVELVQYGFNEAVPNVITFI
jgi:hypothetical protein